MPQMSLFKKFIHITMAIILTCSTINLSLSPLQSITVTAQSPLSTFEQRKTDIKAKQAEIDQQLKDVNVDFESTTNRKSTLAAERKAREEEVNKIKTSIEIIDVLSKKIQGQIEEYKKELQGLENTQAEIYNELWIDSRIPFLAKLLNRNIIESFEAGKKLKNLEDEASKITEEIRSKNQQLEEQLAEQIKLKSQWQAAQAIVDTKVFGLNNLIEQVQNDESKYAQLMKALTDQKKARDIELEKAGIDYKKLEEEITTKNQEAQKAGLYQPNNLVPNNNKPGYIGCWNEANNLNVPRGFFGPIVSKGTYNQPFHCGHDGLDIGGNWGEPLFALADGIVVQTGYDYAAGNHIVIEMTLPSGQKVYSHYLHMLTPSLVRSGDFVRKGQPVGKLGSTGNSSGRHVHLMLIDTSSGNYFCSYGGNAKCYNPARFIDNVIG
ncbi:MAG: peptidoglycan DD-metalloendopeptidase family protein [Candidatus Parcubacteria bacterium]|nr:peptidoglycan DD-metalloendopeptidase family protein [Candidatus Paceibacterota bacterium]